MIKLAKNKTQWLTYLIVGILILSLSACNMDDGTLIDTSGDDNPPVEPWIAAVADATNVLNNAPDFESSLRNIQDRGRTISDQIQAVEAFQPALDVLEDLRGIEIPLLGNAYDALVSGLDLATAGAGQALTTIESGLIELIQIKGDMEALASLDNVADASQNFRNNPSKDTLIALDSQISQSRIDLETVNSDLTSAANIVSNLITAINLVQTGLQGVGDLLNLPIIGDAITSIQNGINDLSTPIRTLQDSINSFQTEVNTNLGVMSEIQVIVSTAQQ